MKKLLLALCLCVTAAHAGPFVPGQVLTANELNSALDAKTSAADLASTSTGKGAALVGYKRTGSGTVASTAQVKLQEVVSVKDFGAGSGGDDLAKFNAAAVAAGTNGQVVIPPGAYSLSGTTTAITWLADANATFTGAGKLGGRIVKLGNGGLFGHASKFGSPSAWLEAERVSTENNADLVVLSSIGQGAILGGSRTSDFSTAGSMGSIGVQGWAINDNASAVQTGYAGYFEARRKAGAGTTQGIEIDVVNQDPATVANQPYQMGATGSTLGLWLASGGEIAATPASLALGIINNGTTFDKGLVFGANAITGSDGVTGTATAIAMAKGHTLQWYGSGGVGIGYINNTVATSANSTNLNFSDVGAAITDHANQLLALTPNVANAVNYPTFNASTTGNAVVIGANGTDSNVGITAAPKGSGQFSVTGHQNVNINTTVTPDSAAIGSGFNIASQNNMYFGGSGATGGRIAVNGIAYNSGGPTSASNTNRNYVGVVGQAHAAYGDGGTNTGAGSKGAFFGLNGIAYADAAATNLLGIVAQENDTFVQSGASAKYVTGLNIVGYNADRGSFADAAILIGGGTQAPYGPHVGWACGFCFSDINGLDPTYSGSTLFGYVWETNPSTKRTVSKGIDFSGFTIGGAVLQSQAMVLTDNSLALGVNGANVSTINAGQGVSAANLDLNAKGGGAVRVQTGNLLVATGTDDGVNALQVAGGAKVTGQLTSTVATGSAPLVVSSTTPVANLSIGGTAANASQLLGSTWAAPAAIGSTTPAAGSFTTLGASQTVSAASQTYLYGNLAGASLPGNDTTAGATIIGWNRSSGAGESDFINAKGAGSPGGFRWYTWNGTSTTQVGSLDSSSNFSVSGSVKSSSATAGIGYTTGAGGTVTQATSKTTGVTLNTVTGQITMNNAALANATAACFTLTNSAIAATDVIARSIASGATAGAYSLDVDAVAAGSARMCLYNRSGGNLSEAVVINYAVVKGSAN